MRDTLWGWVGSQICILPVFPHRQVLEHHRDEMLKYANDGDGSVKQKFKLGET